MIAAVVCGFSLMVVGQNAAPTTAPAVTVYNQDFGVVRATHTFEIPVGVSAVTLKDVAAKIDPTSVLFFCPPQAGCEVLEQNFNYDLVSVGKLLGKMLDQPVEVVTEGGKLYAGTLLAFDDGRLTLAGDDGIQILYLEDEYQAIRLPRLPEGLMLEPALVWRVSREQDGTVPVEVAYQTAGLNWQADYNVLVRPDERRLDITAWVTLTNTSGAAYPEANLKLVAGDVHKVKAEEEAPLIMERMAGAMEAPAPPPGFEERQFAEYHLYELGRPTTIRENQSKQIELFSAHDVGYSVAYEFAQNNRPSRGRYMPYPPSEGGEMTPLAIVLTVPNTQENQLGLPIPAGNVRLYQRDRLGDEHFVGDDTVDHTPKDEELSLILFPHGSPADPEKPERERRENDARCLMYANAFRVPVVYVNSKGSLEYMPGRMGAMMKRRGFRMNGMSKIYAPDAVPIPVDLPEAVASEIRLCPGRRVKDIRFHGDDLLPGNWLFKRLILKPDTEAGIRSYEANR